jgi:hypothetical protein
MPKAAQTNKNYPKPTKIKQKVQTNKNYPKSPNQQKLNKKPKLTKIAQTNKNYPKSPNQQKLNKQPKPTKITQSTPKLAKMCPKPLNMRYVSFSPDESPPADILSKLFFFVTDVREK